jgi:hypothetical protein
VAVRSLMDNFDVYSFNHDSYLSITASKSLSSQSSAIFKDTPLIAITVKATQEGEFNLDLEEQKGAESTKFVDSGMEKLISDVNSSIHLTVN